MNELAQIHIRFKLGQPVHHRLFNYRGVIMDFDETFQQSDSWYEIMAKNNPPKDKPWYCVLVHNSPCMTYVSEENLEPDLSGKPIEHPIIKELFDDFENGLYTPKNILELNILIKQ